jgi:DNA-binding MarR family transcriptional regulator
MSENNLFAQELELQAKSLFLQAKKLQAMADALRANDCIKTTQAVVGLIQSAEEKVKRVLERSDGVSMGVIINKIRRIDKPSVERAIKQMVDNGEVKAVTTTPRRGPTTTRYYLNK